MTGDRRRVVLAPFGSRGDLHPFISIALELEGRGYAPVIAAAPRYDNLVRTAGIEFRAAGPEPQDYEKVLGLSGAEIYHRLCTEPKFMIYGLINPFLRRWYDDMVSILSGAEYFVGHPLALGGRLAAETLGLPRMRVAISPYGLMSTEDPPIWFDAQTLSRVVRRFGLRAKRIFADRLRDSTKDLAKPFHDMRSALGLGSSTANPLYDVMSADERSVGVFSPSLTISRRSTSGDTLFAGFTYFEGVDHELNVSPALNEFLSSDLRPVVFTLGTGGLYDVDRFIAAIRGAASALGFRALVILGDIGRARYQHLNSDSFFVSSYAPYSKIFPRAKVAVHPAGIGTCAQALRAGVPQLLLPTINDQPDTADRVERLGVATVLAMRKLTVASLSNSLRPLIDNRARALRAESMAREIRAEADGAMVIADLVDSQLGRVSRT